MLAIVNFLASGTLLAMIYKFTNGNIPAVIVGGVLIIFCEAYGYWRGLEDGDDRT